MSEVCCDAKVILINYECDICHKGLVQCIDSTCNKDDEGEFHMTYTHRCPSCGAIEELDDIRYPYHKIIPIGPIRQLNKDEL